MSVYINDETTVLFFLSDRFSLRENTNVFIVLRSITLNDSHVGSIRYVIGRSAHYGNYFFPFSKRHAAFQIGNSGAVTRYQTFVSVRVRDGRTYYEVNKIANSGIDYA